MLPRAILLLGAAVLALAGCASPHQQVTIQTDEFSKTVDINGEYTWSTPLGGPFAHWFIRSFVDKTTHQAINQLYVDISYTTLAGWRFYEDAADENSNFHPLTVINRDVESCQGGFIGCDYDETVGIELSNAFLADHQSGFRIKISAHSGDAYIVAVSEQAVKRQLAALAEVGAIPSEAATSVQPAAVPPSVADQKTLKVGIKAYPTPASLATLFHLGKPRGMTVSSVDRGGLADKAGIRPGDILLDCNGRPTDTVQEVKAALTAQPSVRCDVWSVAGAKDGKPVFAEKAVVLTGRP